MLRACLDVLPERAEVVVAELDEAVARWCRDGLLAELTQQAARDPRVRIHIGDVFEAIAAAGRPDAERFDAALHDRYEGPPPPDCSRDHPRYGMAAARVRAAPSDRGILAVWAEDPSLGFETFLE